MDNVREGKLANTMSGLVLEDSASSSTSNRISNVRRSANSDGNTGSNYDSLGEENARLRNELRRKTQELEIYKLNESIVTRSHPVDQRSERTRGPYEFYPSIPSFVNLEDKIRNMGTVKKHNDESFSIKRVQALAGPSHLSSPSTLSVFPRRYPIEGEYDLPFNSDGHESIKMAEVKNSNTRWKQDSALKIRDHEEEISRIKKHLSDYSMKEAQLRNEKCVLEKRIAHMRLAFDQQQLELVDAASKALSYRQDVIEENIRLTYDLQAAQQERTTFVSSLLPILTDYSLQPPVPDAQSIVSNVKVLFKHLQEKLIQTESKLKESQYQLAPWSSDVNHLNVASQSPSNPAGAALSKTGLELVPQLNYFGNTPMASPDARTTEWDVMSHQQRGVAKNTEADDRGRHSPFASRNPVKKDVPAAQYTVTAVDTDTVHYGEETSNRQITFRKPFRNKEMDDPEAEGHKNERKSPANRGTTTLGDPSTSYSPYHTPVLEEPNSSYSEAADDDPLPAIEGLQISGEAFPGRELMASGYSINGTTSCNFEWVRHLEDGSVEYIDGAKLPNYLVTADDVNTYLAIEVQPLDDRNRKGELVKVFANEQGKIVCDPGMQIHIDRALHNVQALYSISIPSGYLDMWEPATLAVKKKGYSIKCSGLRGVVVNDKFSPVTTVSIGEGHPTEFIITSYSNERHVLRADNSTDSSSARDTIVLTMRLFILQASKKKKRGLFFHK